MFAATVPSPAARIADAIEDSSETLYTLEARNNGRPITETRAQLSRVPEWFRYTADSRRPSVRPYCRGDGPYLTYQQRLPLGVCGIITAQPSDILARIVGGVGQRSHRGGQASPNSTPPTTLALADILADAGLPVRCPQRGHGARAAGQRLTGHPDIAKITLYRRYRSRLVRSHRYSVAVRPHYGRTRRQDTRCAVR